jgi:hypothetical protein
VTLSIGQSSLPTCGANASRVSSESEPCLACAMPGLSRGSALHRAIRNVGEVIVVPARRSRGHSDSAARRRLASICPVGSVSRRPDSAHCIRVSRVSPCPFTKAPSLFALAQVPAAHLASAEWLSGAKTIIADVAVGVPLMLWKRARLPLESFVRVAAGEGVSPRHAC